MTVALIIKYFVFTVSPVGRAPVVVKYILLPFANPCAVSVTTQGDAIVIVAVPFDIADSNPIGVLPFRSGILNVVEPSQTQYVVHITQNNVA